MNDEGNGDGGNVIDLDTDPGEEVDDGAGGQEQTGGDGNQSVVVAADLTPVEDPEGLQDEVEEEYEGNI